MPKTSYILPKSYRQLGLGFFVLSLLIFVFTGYLIWAKVTIIIYPNTEELSQEFLFEVKDPGGLTSLVEKDVVGGKLKTIEVEDSGVFQATGSKSLTSDVVGEVTIINNYSKEQTLVATTRLAAFEKPDQILVRLKKTVTVQPGQQIKVQVYPDKPESFKGLEPMKFVIPGLWQGVQDKIYAESSAALGQGGYTVSIVKEEDLAKAEKELQDKLSQKAVAEVNQQLEPSQALWPKLISTKVNEISYDAQVGEETAEFTAKMKLAVTLIAFDESQLISSARERMKETLPLDKQLVSLDPKSFSYTVESYNLEANTAKIKASFKGSSMLTNTAQLFDKSKLVGKTTEEIQSYFSQFPEIKSVEVKFQPSWLKKTPRFQEKIKIEVGEN